MTALQHRTVSATGIALIESFEGLSLTAYRDMGGRWTIGYGHTQQVVEGMTITQEQAESLLKEDLGPVESTLNDHVRILLAQHEFDAVASLVFNIGVGTFERSTLLERLNADDRQGAANQFLRWIYVGGKVEPGLVRRREKERALFLAGDEA